MTSAQQWGVVGAVAMVLGGALWFGSYALKDELVSVEVGSKAPMFSAMTLLVPSTVKTLADYKEQVVLLNVWATWCVPCRLEMPSMELLHKSMGPNGLRVVAVSVDSDSADELRAFMRENKFTFEVLHDAAGLIKEKYQTTAVPETFVIAADGTIRKKSIGASDWNSEPNVALVRQLLAESKDD